MAAKSLDWQKVKAVLSAKDFAVVAEQRARHLELTRLLSQKPAKIDMAHYKQALANQQVVSQIQAALTSFAPVKADAAGILKSLDEQEKEALEQARHTVEHVHQTVSGFKRDLEGIKNVQHFDHLTVDLNSKIKFLFT